VAFADGAIGVFTEEGESVDRESDFVIQGNGNSVEKLVMVWHPTRPLLTVGWHDGTVSFWSVDDRRVTEDSSVHEAAAVSVVVWSPDGERLVTGDDNGKVGVWKVDSRNRPVPIIQYTEKNARVTHVVIPPRADAEACGAAEASANAAASGNGVLDHDDSGPATYFYYAVSGSGKGAVCRGDDRGASSRLYDLDAEAAALLHYDGKGHIVTVGLNSMLCIHEALDGGAMWRQQSAMKLPSEGAATVVWATPGCLAVSNEKDPSCAVRMFDLGSGENFALVPSIDRPADGGGSQADPAGRRVSCLAFNHATTVLACGQKDGHVTMWRYLGAPPAAKPEEEKVPLEDAWQSMAGINVMGKLAHIAWGPQMRLLGALGADGVSVCKKVRLHDKVRDGNSIVQVAADRVMVEAVDGSRPPAALQLNMQVTGADATDKHLLVWNSRKAEVHEVGPNGYVPIASFNSASAAMALHRESVFRAGASMVEVCTLAGVVKTTLVYDDQYGQVEHMDVCKDLAVSTAAGYIKLWRLGGREPKSHGPSGGRKVDVPGIPDDANIESIKVNCNGTKVSILFSLPGSATTHTAVAVYCLDSDSFRTFDFATRGRVPESHSWDYEVPMLFGVQTVAGAKSEGDAVAGDAGGGGRPGTGVGGRPGTGGPSGRPGTSAGELPTRPSTAAAAAAALGAKDVAIPGLLVYTLFSSPEAILVQESHPVPAGFESLLGLCVPSLYVCKKAAANEGQGVCFSITMRDFLGMEQVDPSTRNALLSFNFHLSTDNMDEAFKAVKMIKNPTVWENMAHMCIKSKRLDVAEMCLVGGVLRTSIRPTLNLHVLLRV